MTIYFKVITIYRYVMRTQSDEHEKIKPNTTIIIVIIDLCHDFTCDAHR